MSKEIRNSIFNLPEGGSSGSSWTPQAEYLTVKAAMTSEPLLADQKIQDKWVKDLLPIWDKIIVADNFATHDNQSSFINWKTPGTFDPVTIADPEDQLIQIPYKGVCKPAGYHANINLNFIPSVNGAGFLGKDDITVIIGINGDSGFNEDFGCEVNANDIEIMGRYQGNGFFRKLNTASYVYSYSATSNRYTVLARNNANNIDIYRNKMKRTEASVSTALCDSNLWGLGIKQNGYNTATMAFAIIAKYITEAEVHGVIDACENMLHSYGNNILTYNKATDFNLIIEGHSFVSDVGTDLSFTPDPIVTSINVVSGDVLGTGGLSIAQMIARAAAVDAKLIIETSKYKNELVIWIGVNDVGNTAGQGLTAYNALKPYIQARIIAGWKVFVYTMTPSTSYGKVAEFETNRGVFNNNLRNDLSLISGVYILDTDTVPELSFPCGNHPTMYDANLLHPSILGGVLAGQLFTAKMVELYG